MKTLPGKKTHKIFEVMVNGKLKEVWQRKHTHSLGDMNGCPSIGWFPKP